MRARELVRVLRFPRPPACRSSGPPGYGMFVENARDLVERFARRVVRRAAEQFIRTESHDVHDMAVSAGGGQEHTNGGSKSGCAT